MFRGQTGGPSVHETPRRLPPGAAATQKVGPWGTFPIPVALGKARLEGENCRSTALPPRISCRGSWL
jgi:hypothetical protein